MKELPDTWIHPRVDHCIERVEQGGPADGSKLHLGLLEGLDFAQKAYNDPSHLDVYDDDVLLERVNAAGERERFFAVERHGYTTLFKRIDQDRFMVLDCHKTKDWRVLESEIRRGDYD
ncbi:hypothetical protein J2T57_001518 [Natronocella acetinitrilica]|uniref:Uncharacterized protein n=1 Tax=Natronocella acetinitrilica TaxID=414046 RepID=A0AAE3G276_9GAMM|nr:hypothetical protein [Natronocella acetinitrilica]MCP1674416.1 hypothetical protein [Natronocella acetinitrilica]